LFPTGRARSPGQFRRGTFLKCLVKRQTAAFPTPYPLPGRLGPKSRRLQTGRDFLPPLLLAYVRGHCWPGLLRPLTQLQPTHAPTHGHVANAKPGGRLLDRCRNLPWLRRLWTPELCLGNRTAKGLGNICAKGFWVGRHRETHAHFTAI